MYRVLLLYSSLPMIIVAYRLKFSKNTRKPQLSALKSFSSFVANTIKAAIKIFNSQF